jgi:hypothetical protein
MFSSFIIHSTFTMMGKVASSSLKVVACLLILAIPFGMICSGACLMPTSRKSPILVMYP